MEVKVKPILISLYVISAIAIIFGISSREDSIDSIKPNLSETQYEMQVKSNYIKQVLDFEQEIYEIESVATPFLEEYQKVINDLGAGNVDVYTAYDVTTRAKDAVNEVFRNFSLMSTPKELPEEVSDLLKDGLHDIRTRYYIKRGAFENVQKFLDSQKSSDFQNAKEDMGLSDY